MSNLLTLMPKLEADELNYIQVLLKNADDDKQKQFAMIYNSRRKDPQTILLLSFIGFAGIAGVHRFVLEQVGMGLLYLFTVGLCFIGTIVDLINYKSLAFNYNQKVAREVAGMVGL